MLSTDFHIDTALPTKTLPCPNLKLIDTHLKSKKNLMYFVIENVTIYIEREVREREVSGFRMNFNFVSQFQQKSAYNFALGKIMNS